MSAKANIVVDQGSTFATYINMTDDAGAAIDLTGCSAVGHIRKWYTSTTYVTFNISIPAPATDGILAVSLSSNTTAGMSPGKYVFDIDTINASNTVITRVVEGLLTVTPSVTHISGVTYANGY